MVRKRMRSVAVATSPSVAWRSFWATCFRRIEYILFLGHVSGQEALSNCIDHEQSNEKEFRDKEDYFKPDGFVGKDHLMGAGCDGCGDEERENRKGLGGLTVDSCAPVGVVRLFQNNDTLDAIFSDFYFGFINHVTIHFLGTYEFHVVVLVCT